MHLPVLVIFQITAGNFLFLIPFNSSRIQHIRNRIKVRIGIGRNVTRGRTQLLLLRKRDNTPAKLPPSNFDLHLGKEIIHPKHGATHIFLAHVMTSNVTSKYTLCPAAHNSSVSMMLTPLFNSTTPPSTPPCTKRTAAVT